MNYLKDSEMKVTITKTKLSGYLITATENGMLPINCCSLKEVISYLWGIFK